MDNIMLLKAQAQASYVAGFTKTASVLLPLAKQARARAAEGCLLCKSKQANAALNRNY